MSAPNLSHSHGKGMDNHRATSKDSVLTKKRHNKFSIILSYPYDY